MKLLNYDELRSQKGIPYSKSIFGALSAKVNFRSACRWAKAVTDGLNLRLTIGS
jgi:hypothetical protein